MAFGDLREFASKILHAQHECVSTALAELGSGEHALQEWKHWNSYKNATLCSNLRPLVSKSLDYLIYVFRLFGCSGPAD
jgi:hypothetical protein